MQSVHGENRLDRIVRGSKRGEQIKIPAPFIIISPRHSRSLNGRLDFFSARCSAGHLVNSRNVGLYCRSQWPRGLRRTSAAARLSNPTGGHGCLSVVNVVCC